MFPFHLFPHSIVIKSQVFDYMCSYCFDDRSQECDVCVCDSDNTMKNVHSLFIIMLDSDSIILHSVWFYHLWNVERAKEKVFYNGIRPLSSCQSVIRSLVLPFPRVNEWQKATKSKRITTHGHRLCLSYIL